MKKMKMILLLSIIVFLTACNNTSSGEETTLNNTTSSGEETTLNNTTSSEETTLNNTTSSEETTLNNTTSSQTEVSNDEETSDLKEMSILSDQVKLSIPKTFEIMSEEMAKIKYPNENRPTVIYTNESGTINVAFSHTNEQMSNDDISDYTYIIEDTFKNTYPSAKWYKADVETINELEVGILELITPAADTEIYNLLWISVLDGRMLITTFNCTVGAMDEWQPIAKSILESFRIE